MTHSPQSLTDTPNTLGARRHLLRAVFRFTALLVWLVILAWIVGVFFNDRGGLMVIPHRTLGATATYYFPLIGLIAFFLVWTQIMIGSLRPLWQQLFPGIVRWHRTIGIFVLLFALLHPLLLIFGIGLTSFLDLNFVAPGLVAWVWVGEIQLFLIVVTALTALMRRVTWLRRQWRLIHLLNYIIFCLVWPHSWFLGTDVAHTPLRYLWYWYAATFCIAVTSGIIRALNSSKMATIDNKARNTI